MALLRWLLLPVLICLRLLYWPIGRQRRARAAPKGSFVELRLEGRVSSLARPRPRWMPVDLLRLSRRAPEVSVESVKRLVDEIVGDPRVAGLLLTIEHVEGGWASLAALRDELHRVAAASKRIVAWLPHGGGNRELFLATVASEVLAPPAVDVGMSGARAESLYLREPLDKLGIDVTVHARADYKSAGDMFSRRDRSAADREQVTAIVRAVDDALEGAAKSGRRWTDEQARARIDAGPGRADRSVGADHWIDGIVHDDALEARLGARIVRARRYFARRSAGASRPWWPFGRAAIGVVRVHGGIGERAASPSRDGAVEAQVVADLRAATLDPSIAAVVLDVDSPGGTVTASEAIHAAAARLALEKPLVVHMGDVAASGGFLIAMASDKIVAHPLTITGSIGVVGLRPSAARLVERLGVHRDVIAQRALADASSPLADASDAERAATERQIDAHYAAFVDVVAKGRKRSVEEIEPLARGRVYTGARAFELGLVDKLGDLSVAIAWARASVSGDPRRLLDDAFLVRGRAPAPRPPQPDAAKAITGAAIEALLGPAIADAFWLATSGGARPSFAYFAPLDRDAL